MVAAAGSEVVVGGRKANAPLLFGLQMHSERASNSFDALVLNEVVILNDMMLCLSLKLLQSAPRQDNKVDDSGRIESSSKPLRNKCKRLRSVARALPMRMAMVRSFKEQIRGWWCYACVEAAEARRREISMIFPY